MVRPQHQRNLVTLTRIVVSRGPVVATIAIIVLLISGCSEEPPIDRDEFIAAVTGAGVTNDIAECVYEGLLADDEVMADLEEHGLVDNVSNKTLDRLEEFVEVCQYGTQAKPPTPSSVSDADDRDSDDRNSDDRDSDDRDSDDRNSPSND